MKVLLAGVDQIAQRLSFHANRHRVLATNVANLDTPGYRPVDLEDPQTAGVQSGARLAQTHDRHLSPAALESSEREVVRETAESGVDDNGVDLERELANLSSNRVQYAAASEFVSRRLALLRYAASDGAV